MDLVHRWPIIVLAVAAGGGILLLLWILFNFMREAHSSRQPPLGTPRTPRR